MLKYDFGDINFDDLKDIIIDPRLLSTKKYGDTRKMPTRLISVRSVDYTTFRMIKNNFKVFDYEDQRSEVIKKCLKGGGNFQILFNLAYSQATRKQLKNHTSNKQLMENGILIGLEFKLQLSCDSLIFMEISGTSPNKKTFLRCAMIKAIHILSKQLFEDFEKHIDPKFKIHLPMITEAKIVIDDSLKSEDHEVISDLDTNMVAQKIKNDSGRSINLSFLNSTFKVSDFENLQFTKKRNITLSPSDIKCIQKLTNTSFTIENLTQNIGYSNKFVVHDTSDYNQLIAFNKLIQNIYSSITHDKPLIGERPTLSLKEWCTMLYEIFSSPLFMIRFITSLTHRMIKGGCYKQDIQQLKQGNYLVRNIIIESTESQNKIVDLQHHVDKHSDILFKIEAGNKKVINRPVYLIYCYVYYNSVYEVIKNISNFAQSSTIYSRLSALKLSERSSNLVFEVQKRFYARFTNMNIKRNELSFENKQIISKKLGEMNVVPTDQKIISRVSFNYRKNPKNQKMKSSNYSKFKSLLQKQNYNQKFNNIINNPKLFIESIESVLDSRIMFSYSQIIETENETEMTKFCLKVVILDNTTFSSCTFDVISNSEEFMEEANLEICTVLEILHKLKLNDILNYLKKSISFLNDLLIYSYDEYRVFESPMIDEMWPDLNQEIEQYKLEVIKISISSKLQKVWRCIFQDSKDNMGESHVQKGEDGKLKIDIILQVLKMTNSYLEIQYSGDCIQVIDDIKKEVYLKILFASDGFVELSDSILSSVTVVCMDSVLRSDLFRNKSVAWS